MADRWLVVDVPFLMDKILLFIEETLVLLSFRVLNFVIFSSLILLLLKWPLSSNSNSDPVELIWISIMTVLASSSDDVLHIDYLMSYYRYIVTVLVQYRFHY